MSLQIQTLESIEKSPLSEAPKPNTGSLGQFGGQREIEKIRIDDPEALDPFIRKYSETPEGSTMLSIAVLVAFVVVVAGAIAASILIAPWLLPAVLFPGYLAISVPVECMARRERNHREQKVKDYEACKEAMESDKFRLFAKATLERKEFTPDELLKAHALFQQAQSIQRSSEAFERNVKAFLLGR